MCGNGAAHGTGREMRGGAVHERRGECGSRSFKERDIKLMVGGGAERRRGCTAGPCTELGDKRVTGPCTV